MMDTSFNQIVNDDGDILALLIALFERREHKVSVVADRREMLDSPETKSVNIISLDPMMSGDNGLEHGASISTAKSFHRRWKLDRKTRATHDRRSRVRLCGAADSRLLSRIDTSRIEVRPP
ncbi:response regulator [Gluconacetobacter tumulicola]|uniref:Uncharacterized protein n=1 Tax=Gluconacetobacter tumulicola TaxID=1017177 RepID=A0A7W4JHK7_9PROT|nr:hypothetical protein [Gluconacetobacter tumulicola]MBB2181249.1 hypothetical protein [Gluconacetobacter tumulicola]